MLENSRAARLLAAILSSAEDGLLSFALDGTIRSWSHGSERLYGYTEAEMTGQPMTRLCHVQEVPRYDGLLRAALAGEFPHCENVERRHKDGAILRVRVNRTPIRDERDEIVEILESGTAFSSHQREISNHEELRQIAEQMPMILWTTDRDLRLTSHCGSALRGTRLRADELVGRSVQEYLKCQDQYTTPMAQHYEALRGVAVRFEYKRNNRVLDLHVTPLRSASGEIVGCVGAGLDITVRKKNEEKMRHQATHDALTGLANYREFLDALEREVRRRERSNRSFAVLLMDMDALKHINDRLGHLAGNRALKRLADVMKEQCRSIDLAAIWWRRVRGFADRRRPWNGATNCRAGANRAAQQPGRTAADGEYRRQRVPG
jgi:PAS domain S-box-containing protein